MFTEVGEVKEEEVVVSELFAEVANQTRNLSSIGGVRRMVRFPFATLRNLAYELKVQSGAPHSVAERGNRQ
jgi:predicted PolB exonuclease-like 3'-5' exonuclease